MILDSSDKQKIHKFISKLKNLYTTCEYGLRFEAKYLGINTNTMCDNILFNPHPVTWGQIDPSHQLGSEESPSQQ